MKIQLTFTLKLSNEIKVNDQYFLQVIAEFSNGREAFLCKTQVVKTREGEILGYYLDGDFYGNTETLLNQVLCRLELSMKPAISSWD